MGELLNWFVEGWKNFGDLINWDLFTKIVSFVATLVALSTTIFTILSRSKNKKLVTFSKNALSVLKIVKQGTEKAEEIAGATGEQKKEIAMNFIKTALKEEEITCTDEEISEAIEEDITHTKLINAKKSANQNDVMKLVDYNREGFEL